MKKHGFLKSLLVLMLCAALLVPYLPLSASAAKLDNFDTGTDFSGVKMSVIGDSISTYYGVTNSKTYNPLYLSTSEATFGTYYGNTSHGNYAQFSSVKREDTWWQQTVDTLGMDLLVNNAWSGSFTLVDTAQGNTTEYGAAGYKARCVNLHNGSTKPDIICVYLGTNDVAYYATQPIGSKADVDTASERSALYTSVNNYQTPSTAIEAYFIMLSRMLATYPGTEIYCVLPTIWMTAMGSARVNALNSFNDGVRYLVDYFAGTGKTIYLVDLPANSGLVDVEVVRNYYYCNAAHPSVAGMDWISSCVVSEILEHSQKGKQTATTCQVTYHLSDAFSPTGLPRQTVVGKSFKLDMKHYLNNRNMNITVTMKDSNGNPVTIPGDGTQGATVYIPKVTGDITITVKDQLRSYRWEAKSDAFTSIPGNGYTYNHSTLIGGTYTAGTDTGMMTTAQYSLDKAVSLQYDKPWVLEWKSGGNTYAGGIMLLSDTADSPTDGNAYVHISQSDVFFGYRNSVGYNNSGVAWTTIASKLGSSAGADIRKEMLEFKVVNVPNGTSNKLWLYVNGVEIGTMDSSKKIGGNATHESVGSINLSGRDFNFNYIGSASHSLQNCNVSYIRIYEDGVLQPVTEFADYRWEASGSSFATVENETFTENALTSLGGSVSNGAFSGAVYDLEKDVVLMHDKAWTIEWTSSGTWSDASNGSMLMAGDLYYKANRSPFIYRRQSSTFIGIGEWRDGVHNNYACDLAGNGIDGTVYHKYALRNEPVYAGGKVTSNMVYLYVDDVKVGPLNKYYQGGTDTGTTSDWLSGKDLVFTNIGTTVFSVGGCTMEYLQVKTGCAHEFGSWTLATAPTCTEAGEETRSCGFCGEVDTRAVEATGHKYDAVTFQTTCQTIAHTCYTCSTCGDSYNVYGPDSMGPWQGTKPDAEESLIETTTQYRYRDYETTTSYESNLFGYEQLSSQWVESDSGSVAYVDRWPSGFSTAHSLYTLYDQKSHKVTDTVSDTYKIVVDSDQVTGYLYYHWCDGNSADAVAEMSDSCTNFHAYYSTTNPNSYTCNASDMSYQTAHETCSNAEWFFVTEVSTQSYTNYRNLFTYGRWGNWSDWSETPITASDLRQVETRTAYRTLTTEFAPHNYVNNVCSVCGDARKVQDYYLFGYINGADYACEGDYENLGEYKFVNGQLTATFSQDSYVGVKTADNQSWYMTEGWQGNGVTSVTLYNTNRLTNADKLFVPGGVEILFTLVDNGDDTCALSYELKVCEHSYQEQVTTDATCTEAGLMTYTCTKCGDSYTKTISALDHDYTKTTVAPGCTTAGYTTYTCSRCSHSYQADQQNALGHSYVDGQCDRCGEADPDYVKPSVIPTIALKYPSLSFEDVIIMNVYYTATDIQDVVEMGLITNIEKPEVVSVETADAIIPGYGVDGTFYFSATRGIAPKDLGDTIYFAVYAKLADGTYTYTRMIGYSPKTYALNQLTTGSVEMRPLVAAMLNYGAAAQNYFSYKTDALVNATMTDEQKAMAESYRDDMIASVTQASGDKLGAFINDKTYSKRYPTISFEGAFCINYYFQPTLAVKGDVTMYIWSLEDYEAAEVLTKENATKAVKMELTESGEYLAVVDGIAAKDLDKAAYVSFVYNDGTTEHCGGVLAYTIGMYCKSQASKTGTLAELAKACAVYGYYAKQLFN